MMKSCIKIIIWEVVIFMNKKYSLGFVILHYIVIEDTIECINSIINHIDTDNYEIVVVDNASPNNTGNDLLKKYKNYEKVSVILNKENSGFSKGNNIDIEYLLNKSIDFIAVLNNDTYLIQDDFFKVVNEEYSKSNFGVLGPKIYDSSGYNNSNPLDSEEIFTTAQYKSKYRMYQKMLIKKIFKLRNKLNYQSSIKECIDKRLENVTLHGCCLIFSPEYFKYYNGIEELTFMYGEETILKMNCKQNNLIMVYNPKLKIYHKEAVATNIARSYKKEIIQLYRICKAAKAIYIKSKQNYSK